MRFSAFISYSHEVDAELARRLRNALQSFARPWHRLRAVRVFQDSSSLAVDPSLWTSVQSALDQSDYLIVLASPEAAGSDWVDREIRHWLETHDLDTVLLVLTSGEIAWNAGLKAFETDVTDALPPALVNAYGSEPLYLDLRWAKNVEELTLRHPQFRDAVATLQSVLRKQPKDELIGEDVRNHRSARRLAWSGGTLVVALAVAATFAAIVANQQRQEAEQQRDTANARLLGVQAEQLLDQNPELRTRAVLLAIEAVHKGAGPQAERALRSGTSLLPKLVTRIAVSEPLGNPTALVFDPGGERLLVGGSKGIGVWDSVSGELQSTRDVGSIDGLALTGDGRSLAALGRGITLLALDDLEVETVLSKAADSRGVFSKGEPGWFAWSDRTGTVVTLKLEPGATPVRFAPSSTSDTSGRRQVAISRNGRVVAATGPTRDVEVWSVPAAAPIRTVAVPPDLVYDDKTIALSPDGDLLAKTRDGNSVEVWRLSDGAMLLDFSHGAGVATLAFSPDNRWLLTAGGGSVRIWDRDGREVYRILYEEDVDQIAFSENGDLLAIAGWNDPSVTIWDLGADPAGRIALPVTRANGVALGPNSRFLATAEDDGVARVWDLDNGQAVQQLVHPPDELSTRVSGLAFSRDEAEVTATSYSGLSTVWSLATGGQIASLETEEIRYDSRPSPGGALVAGLTTVDNLAGMRRTQVWNVRTGQNVATIDHDGSDWRPLMSPDSRLVAIKRYSEALIYSVGERELVARLGIDPALEIEDLVFSPDTTFLLAGGEDETLTVWDLASDSVRTRIPHDETVSHVDIAPDGSVAATVTAAGTIRVFATDDWQELLQFGKAERIVAVDVGTSTIVTADEADAVEVRDIVTGELLAETTIDDRVQLVAVGPDTDVVAVAGRRSLSAFAVDDGEAVLQRRYLPRVTAFARSDSGRYVAVGTADGDMEVWDLVEATRVVASSRKGDPVDVDDVLFSGDAKRLITVADAVHIWDLGTGAEIDRLPLSSFGGAVDLSPDGRHLAVGTSSSQLTVWDVETSRPVMTASHDNRIASVAISPDGRLVSAAGPPSGAASVWRIADGQLHRTVWTASGGGLLDIAFHPDGERLVAAGRNGSVTVLRLADGAELARLLQGKPILGFDLTADGRFMATASNDYTVRVWSLESNQLASLVPHAAATRSLALGARGSVLATVDAENELSVWRLDRERLIADACARVDRNLQWDEWQQYLGNADYRKTCPERPLHDSFFRAAFEMAKNGDTEGARSQLQRATELEADLEMDVDEELRRMARHIDHDGERLAERGLFDHAERQFEVAMQLAGADPYDYAQRARRIAIDEKLDTALDDIMDGKAKAALELVEQSRTIDPSYETPAYVLDSICTYGTAYGHADRVLGVCDEAISLAGDDVRGFMTDSRGVARMAAGDFAGAIADFEVFIDWASDDSDFAELVRLRELWIEALSAGTNPFESIDLLAHSNYMTDYRRKMGLPWMLVSSD